MKKQEIILLKSDTTRGLNNNDIDSLNMKLKTGWEVISVTAQHISTGGNYVVNVVCL
jgi:tRNA A58 N-methylase Trm61